MTAAHGRTTRGLHAVCLQVYLRFFFFKKIVTSTHRNFHNPNYQSHFYHHRNDALTKKRLRAYVSTFYKWIAKIEISAVRTSHNVRESPDISVLLLLLPHCAPTPQSPLSQSHHESAAQFRSSSISASPFCFIHDRLHA